MTQRPDCLRQQRPHCQSNYQPVIIHYSCTRTSRVEMQEAQGEKGNARGDSARAPGGRAGMSTTLTWAPLALRCPAPLPSLGTLSVQRTVWQMPRTPVLRLAPTLCPGVCGLLPHSFPAIASHSFTGSLIQQTCIKSLLCAGDIMVMGSDFWWSGQRKSGEVTLEQGAE